MHSKQVWLVEDLHDSDATARGPGNHSALLHYLHVVGAIGLNPADERQPDRN